MATYLTTYGQPSVYGPSLTDLQNLYANLTDVPAVINQSGEGMSVEYPTEFDVASYVMNGGVYIDWCGWPMWYAYVNGELNEDNNRFGRFLNSAGVSSDYVSTFIPGPANPFYGLTGLSCPNAPYPRMWVSSYFFPASNSAIITGGPVIKCDNVGIAMYAYSLVTVHAGKGYYFWAYAKGGSTEVDALTYANFIRSVLGYSQIAQQPSGPMPPSSGSQPNCPPGYAWNGKECVQPSGSSQTPCAPGYYNNGYTCVPISPQGGLSTSVNWILVGGIAVAVLGLIGVIFANTE